MYLSDEDDAVLRARLAAGDSLRSIIRRGLGVERADLVQARAVAAEAVDAAEDRLQGLARDMITDAVREALRQGGGGY